MEGACGGVSQWGMRGLWEDTRGGGRAVGANWGSNFGCLATVRFEIFSLMLSATREVKLRTGCSSLQTAIELVYSICCGIVGTSSPVSDVVRHVIIRKVLDSTSGIHTPVGNFKFSSLILPTKIMTKFGSYRWTAFRIWYSHTGGYEDFVSSRI
jgi:hypothetical protein